MAAVKRGDMETARRMVGEAATEIDPGIIEPVNDVNIIQKTSFAVDE